MNTKASSMPTVSSKLRLVLNIRPKVSVPARVSSKVLTRLMKKKSVKVCVSATGLLKPKLGVSNTAAAWSKVRFVRSRKFRYSVVLNESAGSRFLTTRLISTSVTTAESAADLMALMLRAEPMLSQSYT